MDFLVTLVRFFHNGGVFMYPILFILVIGVAIIVERVIYIGRAWRENHKLWTKLMPLVNRGEYESAENLANKSRTAIGRVLGYGISRARASSATREQVEMAMEESLMEVTPQLERRTHYLAVFSNVATLMGLLGTIVGLIHGFSAVSSIDAAQKASQLSEAVAIALNCTAFGLIVAIPFLLIHAWLQARTDQLVDSIEMAAVKFVNSLGLNG